MDPSALQLGYPPDADESAPPSLRERIESWSQQPSAKCRSAKQCKMKSIVMTRSCIGRGHFLLLFARASPADILLPFECSRFFNSMSKRPAPLQPSQRRLKQYQGAGKDSVSMNVGVTGARAGDLLRGVSNASSGDTANVLIRIDSGVVPAPGIIRRSIEDSIGRDKVVQAYAKHFGCSLSTAALRYSDCPVDEDAVNHRALGSGCNHSQDAETMCDCVPAATFTILSQGAWQEFADAHGNGAALRAMVEEGRSVCWKDVLKLMQTAGQMGGKTLILRPRLFEIAAAPQALAADDPRLAAGGADIIECVPPWLGHAPAPCVPTNGAVYELDGQLVRLPASATAPFASSDVVGAVLEALNGGRGGSRLLAAEVTHAEVAATVEVLSPLTAGGLKSCMQKAVRFHASHVTLSTSSAKQSASRSPAALVAAVCAALLCSGKGSFSPELQLFTRGGTASFKRIAITLLEDAWVEDMGAATAACALTTLALAMQRMHSYEPPRATVIAALQTVARAALSPTIIAWRKADAGAAIAHGVLTVSSADQQALKHAAVLMRKVRSFEGDMAMFESVAKLAARGVLPVRRCEKGEQPAVMPLCHMVDQHCTRAAPEPESLSLAGSCSRFPSFLHTIPWTIGLFSQATGASPTRSAAAGPPSLNALPPSSTRSLASTRAVPRQQASSRGPRSRWRALHSSACCVS